MSATLTEYYNRFFIENADTRVEKWPLMKDPSTISVICFLYLTFVLRIGPHLMKNRPPFGLHRILQVYNIFQVCTCIYLVYGMWENGWKHFNVFKCQPVKYDSSDRQSMDLLTLTYLTTMLKVVEFLETIFFVLRKKYNQISNLHLYHHISTLWFMWIVTKYVGGGMVTFYPFLNNIVHIVMYTYYFLATLGSVWQKRLEPLKPKITLMQMTQFVIMILHACLSASCNMPKILCYSFFANVFINFGMFFNFFVQNYRKKGKKV